MEQTTTCAELISIISSGRSLGLLRRRRCCSKHESVASSTHRHVILAVAVNSDWAESLHNECGGILFHRKIVIFNRTAKSWEKFHDDNDARERANLQFRKPDQDAMSRHL